MNIALLAFTPIVLEGLAKKSRANINSRTLVILSFAVSAFIFQRSFRLQDASKIILLILTRLRALSLLSFYSILLYERKRVMYRLSSLSRMRIRDKWESQEHDARDKTSCGTPFYRSRWVVSGSGYSYPRSERPSSFLPSRSLRSFHKRLSNLCRHVTLCKCNFLYFPSSSATSLQVRNFVA